MLCCEQRTFWLDTQSATLSWGKSLYAKSAKSARLLAALPHPDIPDGASPATVQNRDCALNVLDWIKFQSSLLLVQTQTQDRSRLGLV